MCFYGDVGLASEWWKARREAIERQETLHGTRVGVSPVAQTAPQTT